METAKEAVSALRCANGTPARGCRLMASDHRSTSAMKAVPRPRLSRS